ncbi:branched-chain amino acid ABC transporter ATP-binding protein/permease [Actinomadura madurae]|uniref:branched-chain amino acid ABC transporter ATP-binding protein/permease n=1 Tax=Actinomadura madurae TaxID=1993 RepID=UPI002026FB88|nr:branched-chain amino acid ABC transporter ATP-binding protein/permease [Actinomadura madurae]URN03875.1 branched-chain amino acid ABC transporter ATP-binding protein/permease [Actinomadura madurae]
MRARVRASLAARPAGAEAAVRYGGWPLLIAAALVAGGTLDDYALTVASTILIYAILGLGINIVVGYAGLLDLGFAAFFAIGAYASGLLMLELEWGFWVTLPAAVAAAAVAGVVIGYPTLRLRSDYLAIVTLGFGEIIRITVVNLEVTGGPNGLTGIPPVTVGGREIVTPRDFFYLALAFFTVVLAATALLARSRLAYAWRAIRADDTAAEAVGVPARRVKLLAYVLGAVTGAVAGPLNAAQLGTVDPSSFTFLTSLMILLVVIIGGMGSRPGVMIGAVVIVALPEVLRTVQEYRGLFFALLLILIVILRPQGVWPYRPRRFRLPAEPGPAPDLPAAAGTLLEVDGLSRTFGGVTAVDGFALRAGAGQVVSVIGPNGAGKTTAFNCITGMLAPSAGTVVLGGRSVRGLAPHRVAAAGLARTFQSIRLFDEMTVAENVLIGRFARDRGLLRPLSRADLDTVRRCLDFTGLLDAADRPAGGLPYGDRRRLEIARALAGDPRVLLLDEPAAGANPTEKRALMELISRISALGTAVVLIEHDVALVMSISDRVTVLEYGRTIAVGPPAEIREDQRVIAAYLGVPDDPETDLVTEVLR